MEIIYEISESTLAVQLFGEMDHHASEKVRRDIDDMMETYGAEHLIFDFSRVTFMDSAGIGIVLGRYKKISSAGGKVVIVGCSPRIRAVLNLAGVFSVMESMETKEEAFAFLQGREVS